MTKLTKDGSKYAQCNFCGNKKDVKLIKGTYSLIVSICEDCLDTIKTQNSKL